MLTVLLGVAAADAASAEQQPGQAATDASLGYVGIDPGTVREFDIQAGRVEDPLPFDVQFFIQSAIDSDVEEVDGRFLQAKDLLADQGSCDELFPSAQWEARGYLAPLVMITRGGEQVALAGPPVQRPAVPPRTPIAGQRDISFIRFLDSKPATGDQPEGGEEKAATRTVELSVPPLAPNREICFEFHFIRKVDQAEFRRRARAAVESELQSPDWVVVEEQRNGERLRSTIGSARAFNRLRRSLIRRILAQAERGERLEAPPGSFFDPHVNLAGVEADYQRRFVEILGNGQTNRFRTLEGIQGTNRRTGTRDELVVSLRRLVTSDVYKRLAASGTLAKTLLGDTLVPGLRPDTSVADSRKWADGLVGADGAATATALTLERVWSPADLEDKVAGAAVTPGVLTNLERGLRELEALERVVMQYRKNQDLARMDGLTLAPGACSVSGAACSDFQTSGDCGGNGQCVGKDVRQLEELVGEALNNLDLHLKELTELHRLLSVRQREIDSLLDELALELETTVRLLGTTTGSYETRASFYISADVGVGFAPDVEETFTYFGTNIYFRPVNKKAPLRGLSFKKRFSIMIGLTSESLESNGQLKGLVGNQPLLLAGGLRLNDFLRLSAGAVIFRDEDPNPLITTEELAWSPYVSLSIDWNLRKLFARFGGALNLTDPPSAAAAGTTR